MMSTPLAGMPANPALDRDLTEVLVSRRVRTSDMSRRAWGSETDMNVIASALSAADYGNMVDIADMIEESIDLDPHLASLYLKRTMAVAGADWDVTPAQAVERGDREWAARIAEDLRSVLSHLPMAQMVQDLAWAVCDGRSALEVHWALGAWGQRIAPFSVTHIPPRNLCYGASRELRQVDAWTARQAFTSDMGIDVEETPGKFLFWKPRLFRAHQEREGLGRRTLYWAFFKRFAMKWRMKLMELFALPWRTIEIDKDAPANPKSVEAALAQVENLGGETTAVLDRGMHVNVEWPGENSGQLMKLTHDDVNAEQSKIVLGTRSTSDPDANRANSIIGKGEQDIIWQSDGRGVSDSFKPLAYRFTERNHPGAVHLTPTIQLRTQPQRDRERELGRVKAYVSMGGKVAESEFREISGFREPTEDEKFLRLGAPSQFGEPSIEVVDPTAPPAPDDEPSPPGADDDATGLLPPSAEPKTDPEDEGVAGQSDAAEQALRDALGLTRTAYALEAYAPPTAVFGSPAALVSKGVIEGARETSKWAAALAAASDGPDAVSVRRSVDAAGAKLNLEPFAKTMERRIVWGLMLGALDAHWEAENDRIVKPPAFAIEVNRRAPDDARRRIAADARAAYGVQCSGDVYVSPFPWTGIPGCDVCGFGSVEDVDDFDPALPCPGCAVVYPLAGGVKDWVARPFNEAIADFLKRKVVTRRTFDRMAADAKRRAFTIAGVARKDIIATAHKELVRALEDGDDLRRFSARLNDRFKSAGWTKLSPSRVEVVFRNGTMGAYARGRDEQMTQPEVLAARPYWQILGVKDNVTRGTHAAAHGKVLRADDAFWKRAPLPFGHNCRCRKVSRSARDLERLGLQVVSGASLTGLPDKGWNAAAL